MLATESPFQRRNYRRGSRDRFLRDVERGLLVCDVFSQPCRADAGASGNRIILRYKRLAGGSYGAVAPTFWTVSQRTKPGGAPTRLSSFTGTALKPGEIDTVTLPSARATELLDGTAGGIACHVAADTPYLQLAGRAAYSAAMSLSVRSTR